ncbi:38_t:CDS:2, partial [Acaulospora morrowiae]
MNGDRLSSTSKTRKPRVKNSAKLTLDTARLSPPPLFRSNTAPGKSGASITNTGARTPRSGNSISSEKEKVRSDDGFQSDSDKDSNQSAHSVHSNLSAYSGMSRTPSIKSDTIVRVRPKSSLGSDLSDKSQLDSLSLAHLAVNRQLQADKQAEEARKNRKIADLEISIRSLTAINAELDATNKKQAAEIIELKRKLRIYNDDSFMSEIYDIDDDISSSLTEASVVHRRRELAEIAKENDIRFRRICHAMDELLRDAQAALDYSTKIVGSRVITDAHL